ncbi:MAG: tRNA (cytidine(34)-2'-O)-methyltransferase [Candidatus Muirbacterium halophilum]|nr:tRNA (cytidine(34)-2'-O)-methyltransferase [Candidatus Muirbacterium halophilum]MCK9475747.1 tRNA (cytidine(34)-2'-O)-methyltransferase [Candidatus Muirbacterium halophilum]
MFKFNIVLVEPEIPPNTGNIARTCAATGCRLFLVGKLGFSTEDKYLKRAGLDYWEHVKVEYKESIEDLIEEFGIENFYFLSKKASKNYSQIKYKKNDFLVFGKETFGLSERLLLKYKERTLRIPTENVRSLNLSTSCGIVLFEALRQNDFFGIN